MGINSSDLPHDDEGIDVEKDPFAYNKDFDPHDPTHFTAWLKMKPTHMSQGEWQFAVGELKLMLESDSVKTERDTSMLMLGWKKKNGLIPNQ